MISLDELWHVIEEAPGHVVSSYGRVKFGGAQGRKEIQVQRTSIRGRRYVDLIVERKIKRFYVDKLIARYFKE